MKFRCLATKNIVEFKEQVDIDAMLNHPQYEVVEEVAEAEKPVKPKKGE